MVWTDVFQSVIMLAGLLSIVIQVNTSFSVHVSLLLVATVSNLGVRLFFSKVEKRSLQRIFVFCRGFTTTSQLQVSVSTSIVRSMNFPFVCNVCPLL